MPETEIVVASLKGLSASPAAIVVRERLIKLGADPSYTIEVGAGADITTNGNFQD